VAANKNLLAVFKEFTTNWWRDCQHGQKFDIRRTRCSSTIALKTVYETPMCMATNTDAVELVGEETTGNIARAALFAALTGVFAYVSFQLPVTSVPFTLQVLGVFLAGLFLGPVWGFASMGLYLVAGAAGAPVFAYGASGVGSLFTQWAGYLWSYPVAAGVLGAVVHGTGGLTDPGERSLGRLLLGLLAATVVIYALGTLGYALVGNVGLVPALLAAAVPFVPAEAIKAAVAVAIVRSDEIAAA
jgi:biotin transport system substrate-specific component